MSTSRKKFHECRPGEIPENPMFRDAQIVECRAHCRFFEQTGDEVHLWRAWKAARAIFPMPNECLEAIAPHLDGIALQTRKETRANQTRIRNTMITHFYDMRSRPRGARPTHLQTETAILDHVARQYGKTGQVLKQFVLKHEGRLGNGRPAGRRW